MSDIGSMLKENTKGVADDDKTVEQIDIDYLIHDILIIKAESVKNPKIFGYADYLEKQLLKIKRGDAVW